MVVSNGTMLPGGGLVGFLVCQGVALNDGILLLVMGIGFFSRLVKLVDRVGEGFDVVGVCGQFDEVCFELGKVLEWYFYIGIFCDQCLDDL